MDIFDGNITNWKDISGMDQDILIFRFSDLTNYYTEEELGDEFQYVPQKISELVAKEPGIIAFFPKQYLLENGREDHIRGVLRRDEMVPDLDTGPYIRIDSFVVGHITG